MRGAVERAVVVVRALAGIVFGGRPVPVTSSRGAPVSD
jgi:hypothetical protein